MRMKHDLKGLPFTIFEITPVLAGWSADEKYRVVTKDGVFLLRLSPEDQYERKLIEFQAMQKMAGLGVPMSRAIDMGRYEHGVYSLQEWIEGEDAEALIPTLPTNEQARLGKMAGGILKTIHSIPRSGEFEDWDTLFNRKIDKRIQNYLACPLKYEGDAFFFRAIERYRGLLKNRPQSCHHGDYHVGNMMIDRDGQLVLIDFDRLDFGDPWEEFNRLFWSVKASAIFAKALVDAYFDSLIPSCFWELFQLYISVNALSSLPWAIPFGDKDVSNMREMAGILLDWYPKEDECIPTWYREYSI